MELSFRVFSLILVTLTFSQGAKILGVFPTPSISHQAVFHGLFKELAARGHQLTIIAADPMPDHPNITQIDVHDLYQLKHEVYESGVDQKDGAMAMIEAFSDFMLQSMESILDRPEVKKLMSNTTDQTFDLVVFENFPHFVVSAAFGKLFKCPVVGITSLEAANSVHEDFGNEANIGIHPIMLLGFEHAELSIIGRVKSLIFTLMYQNTVDPIVQHRTNLMLKKHFPSIKSWSHVLRTSVDFLMINTSPVLGFNRPLAPNVIQLGFMHVEPPKPLPSGKLKSFLDNSKHGVIYMSLGSNVSAKEFLGDKVIAVFMKVFTKYKYDVVLKYDEELPEKPKNVMVGKWFPQADLLAHPKVKLFITQGGQQSMEEAIDRKVPMVVIPVFGDQMLNAKRIVKKGIGVELDKDYLFDFFIERAITETMLPKYKQKISEISEIIKDQPMTSREKAAWWCEYVIRNKGAEHLKYPGRDVSFISKYYIDVFVLGYILYRIAKRLVPKILRIVFTLVFGLLTRLRSFGFWLWKKYKARKGNKTGDDKEKPKQTKANKETKQIEENPKQKKSNKETKQIEEKPDKEPKNEKPKKAKKTKSE